MSDYYKHHLGKGIEIWKPFWDKAAGLIVPMLRKVIEFDPRTDKGWVRDYDSCNARCHKLASRYPKAIAPNV